MEVQGRGKCCFCERKFESGDLGRYELDIEHFRPKGKITAWDAPQSLLDEGIRFTDPPDASHGYYLLPYHLLNLTVACKPCNSGLKKSYSPIRGTYDLHGDDPRQMHTEQPWLLYPLGLFRSDQAAADKVHDQAYAYYVSRSLLFPASRECQTPPSSVATTRLGLMPG